MKNFQNYTPEKYASPAYRLVEEGIYRTAKPKNMLFGFPNESKEHYVTSLSFEMEPESFGEEGGCPRDITQIPFENILDDFYVYVTDFYDALNAESDRTCYQQFGSDKIENIRNLRTLIGKRFYAVPCEEGDEDAEDEEYKIVIE